MISGQRFPDVWPESATAFCWKETELTYKGILCWSIWYYTKVPFEYEEIQHKWYLYFSEHDMGFFVPLPKNWIMAS